MKQKVILLSISVILIAAFLYATKGTRSAEATLSKRPKRLSVTESATANNQNVNVGAATTLFSYQEAIARQQRQSSFWQPFHDLQAV